MFESNILPNVPDLACVNSRKMVLVREDYADDQYEKEEFEHLGSGLRAFRKNLRHVNGQVDVPKHDDLVIGVFGRKAHREGATPRTKR